LQSHDLCTMVSEGLSVLMESKTTVMPTVYAGLILLLFTSSFEHECSSENLEKHEKEFYVLLFV